MSDNVIISIKGKQVNENGPDEMELVTAGRLAAFSALFAAYGFMKKRRLPAQIFYGFAILVSLMTLAHSQSRTCFIALGAAAGALAFRAVWLRMEGRRIRIPAGLIAGSKEL